MLKLAFKLIDNWIWNRVGTKEKRMDCFSKKQIRQYCFWIIKDQINLFLKKIKELKVHS